MMKTDVLGIEDLRKDLRRMDREFKKNIKKKVREGTNYLRDKIREGTPVDEGDLKKATKTQIRGFDGRVVILASAWYWLVVEYGSDVRGLPGTLYSQKIIERERPKAEQIVVDGVDEVLLNG